MLCFLVVIGKLLFVIGQRIFAVYVGIFDTFPAECSHPGYIIEMVIYMRNMVWNIVRGYLTRHVDGNPGLQPQHQFFKRPVQRVDDVQMQPFFDGTGNGKHPFFIEIIAFCHIGHWHIGAHKDRL